MKNVFYFIGAFIASAFIMYGFETITGVYLFQKSSIAVIILFIVVFIAIKGIFDES